MKNNRSDYRGVKKEYGAERGGRSYGGEWDRDETYGARGGYGKSRDENYGRKGGYDKNRDGAPRGGSGKPPFDRRDKKPPEYRRENDFARDRGFKRAERDEPAAKPSYGIMDKPAENTEYRDELPNIIMGRNAVKEAIKSGRSIDKIWVNAEQDGSLREILGLARDKNLLIREVPRQKLDELCMPFGHGQKTGNHQGIAAFIPGAEYCDIQDILDAAAAKGEKPFVVLLDGIEDPHNLGSIIRSAVCSGAHGIVITKRRSASLTAAAVKASAGAVAYANVAKVSNLSNAIDRLKEEGLWIAGADMSGTAMHKADMKGALGLVIGSEGEGISRLVAEKCDFMVSIPMSGAIDSLNASVAAGILMFEKRRQDITG